VTLIFAGFRVIFAPNPSSSGDFFMLARPLLVAAFGLLCLHLQAQSLGEIARQQQQKKQPDNNLPKKVLTNDDMPAASSTTSAGSKPPDKGTSPGPRKDPTTTWSAEKFRSEIQKQKDAIAETQKAIATIEPTINHVQNNRNIYTNAPEYNSYQDEKQRTVNQLKGRLAEQRGELLDLQEQARKAGYGNSIYQ